MQSGESISNQDSGVWPESVVVKNEVLKGYVRGQESNERGLGIQTEGVIVEIDCMEFRQGEQGCKKMRECLWNFIEKSSCKYICKVRNLGKSRSAQVLEYKDIMLVS